MSKTGTVIEAGDVRVTIQGPRTGKLQLTVERRPAPARGEEEIADAIGTAHGQGQEEALKEVAKLLGCEPYLASISERISERDAMLLKRLVEEAGFTPLPRLSASSDKDLPMQFALLYREHLLRGVENLRGLRANQEAGLARVAEKLSCPATFGAVTRSIDGLRAFHLLGLCEDAGFVPLPVLHVADLHPDERPDFHAHEEQLLRTHLLTGIESMRNLWHSHERDHAAALAQLKQVRADLEICREQHKAAGNWIEVLAQLKGAVLARRAAAEAGWVVNDLNRANERAIEELMMVALRMFPEEPPTEEPPAEPVSSEFRAAAQHALDELHAKEARFQVQADAFATEMRELDEAQRDSAQAYQAQAEAAGPAGVVEAATQVLQAAGVPRREALQALSAAAAPQHLDAEAVRRSQGIALVPAAPPPDDEHRFVADGRCARCRQPQSKVGDKPCPGRRVR